MSDEEWGPRGAAPSATPHNDPDAPGTAAWIDMPPAARASACLAALLAGWPIDTTTMRFNRRTGIVFLTRPAVRDPALPPSPRKQVLQQESLQLQQALDRIRAGFGLPRELEVRKLISARR